MELHLNQESGVPQSSATSESIVDGWTWLRQGRFDDAESTFSKILAKDAENVDAHYGKGLSLRAVGKVEAAIETFQKALDISRNRLREIRQQYGGDETRTSLESIEDDRYMMMERMLRQRLSELGVKAS